MPQSPAVPPTTERRGPGTRRGRSRAAVAVLGASTALVLGATSAVAATPELALSPGELSLELVPIENLIELLGADGELDAESVAAAQEEIAALAESEEEITEEDLLDLGTVDVELGGQVVIELPEHVVTQGFSAELLTTRTTPLAVPGEAEETAGGVVEPAEDALPEEAGTEAPPSSAEASSAAVRTTQESQALVEPTAVPDGQRTVTLDIPDATELGGDDPYAELVLSGFGWGGSGTITFPEPDEDLFGGELPYVVELVQEPVGPTQLSPLLTSFGFIEETTEVTPGGTLALSLPEDSLLREVRVDSLDDVVVELLPLDDIEDLEELPEVSVELDDAGRAVVGLPDDLAPGDYELYATSGTSGFEDFLPGDPVALSAVVAGVEVVAAAPAPAPAPVPTPTASPAPTTPAPPAQNPGLRSNTGVEEATGGRDAVLVAGGAGLVVAATAMAVGGVRSGRRARA